MSAYINQQFVAQAKIWMSHAIETAITILRQTFNGEPEEMIDVQTPSPSLSNTKDTCNFRRVQMPETKVGLGSTEGDLVFMLRKYLEIVGLVFFVWLLGYFHFSVSWILLAVFIYLFRQRQRTQFKQRHKMLNEINNNEEQYIKARLDELPSWVFFPDVERAEWVNRIIKQAWPYANRYLDQAVFREVLIPLIRGTSPALADFSFEKLDLGETPPRIGGIKVYTDHVRDQIIMDVEVFYAGDAHVKAKVKGIVCGIKDIEFVGDIRIILSPLINTIPFVGAVTYFFLRKPSINLKLTDAGTLVDIPGLNDLMLGQINDIVASMMVLPNRQVFALVQNIPTAHLRWSNPQGVIRIFLIRARNLIKADITLLGKGKSDPFVRVKAQGNIEYRTKTINNTTEPEWNEVFEFPIEQYENEQVNFEVYDEDPGKDDFIGRAQFQLDSLIGKDMVDTWLILQDVKKGSLNVSLQYFTLTTDRNVLELIDKVNNQPIYREKLSKALVVCFIDRCLNLPRSKKTRREPNAFCRIKVESSESKTPTLESQTNPLFEHVSQILCKNPLHEKIRIDVCDARQNNDVIAFFELPIKQIFNTDGMIIEAQSYPLKSFSEPLDNAVIILRLSLLLLSPTHTSEDRLNPPLNSPVLSRDPSFDSSAVPTTDLRRSLVKESIVRSSIENENENRSNATEIQRQSSASIGGIRSIVENRVIPDRKTFIIADDPDLKSTRYGQIKLGIRYAASRKSLSVTIFECKQLINVHEQNLPDPYVRVSLTPDFRKDKKKTKSVHDTLNPKFEDLFEWSVGLNDIRRQHLSLSIKNNSPLFAQEQIYMGELEIDLSNLDPEKTSVAWYALQEPNTSAGCAIKIKYDTFESNEQTTQS